VGGIYVVLLAVESPVETRLGKRQLTIAPGIYGYVGSAAKHFGRRVGRHLRRKKKLRWHIDSLTAKASVMIPLAFAGSRDECGLADALAAAGRERVEGFGSSDCRCRGHLIRF
jgi:sugar fermentation stimulation protein A